MCRYLWGEGRGEGILKLKEERHSLRIMDGDHAVATRLHWVQGEPPAGVKNPQIRYRLDNHLGSATLELDESAQIISYEEYYPYGGTSFVMGRNQAEVKLKQYRYSGKEQDSVTGFYYYGFRYYAPWLCRWLSPDPAGTVDGLNLYGFVKGEPLGHKDKDGRCTGNARGRSSSSDTKKRNDVSRSRSRSYDKFQVEKKGDRYVYKGRPAFMKKAIDIEVSDNEDRRHVIGWSETIKEYAENIFNIVIKNNENKFGELMVQQYEEYKLARHPKVSSSIKEHMEYAAKQLNSSPGNLNPEDASENRAIEIIRKQAASALSTIREEGTKSGPLTHDQIKELATAAFKEGASKTGITEFANAQRKIIKEMITNSSKEALLISQLNSIKMSTAIDLCKKPESKDQTSFALIYYKDVRKAATEEKTISDEARLSALFSLLRIPKQ